jgi:hypothetical protein
LSIVEYPVWNEFIIVKGSGQILQITKIALRSMQGHAMPCAACKASDFCGVP